MLKKFTKNLLASCSHFASKKHRVVSHPDDLRPPRALNYVGNGDYSAIGLEFRDLFIQIGGLRPGHRVLDVGCGIGRMAVPLTSYLSPDAEYQGFDVVRKGIDWCQRNISSRFPHFHFQHSDVHNHFYNPRGTALPSNYQFPFGDNFFDFVFATSLFTHMRAADTNHYLAEISRVLKPGGTCFTTLFLINQESKSLIANGSSTQNFDSEIEGGFTTRRDKPETAIAFDDEEMRKSIQRVGLTIMEPVRYGSWCGRASFLSYQDIVVASKVVDAGAGAAKCRRCRSENT